MKQILKIALGVLLGFVLIVVLIVGVMVFNQVSQESAFGRDYARMARYHDDIAWYYVCNKYPAHDECRELNIQRERASMALFGSSYLPRSHSDRQKSVARYESCLDYPGALWPKKEERCPAWKTTPETLETAAQQLDERYYQTLKRCGETSWDAWACRDFGKRFEGETLWLQEKSQELKRSNQQLPAFTEYLLGIREQYLQTADWKAYRAHGGAPPKFSREAGILKKQEGDIAVLPTRSVGSVSAAPDGLNEGQTKNLCAAYQQWYGKELGEEYCRQHLANRGWQ